MTSRDLKSNIQLAQGLIAVLSGVTPVTGNIVDTREHESAACVVSSGTVTDAGTAAGITVKLQESDTTVTGEFTDITGATATLLVDTEDDVPIGIIHVPTGTKRYVRAIATGSTGTDATISAQFILGDAHTLKDGALAANIAAT